MNRDGLLFMDHPVFAVSRPTRNVKRNMEIIVQAGYCTTHRWTAVVPGQPGVDSDIADRKWPASQSVKYQHKQWTATQHTPKSDSSTLLNAADMSRPTTSATHLISTVAFTGFCIWSSTVSVNCLWLYASCSPASWVISCRGDSILL